MTKFHKQKNVESIMPQTFYTMVICFQHSKRSASSTIVNVTKYLRGPILHQVQVTLLSYTQHRCHFYPSLQIFSECVRSPAGGLKGWQNEGVARHICYPLIAAINLKPVRSTVSGAEQDIPTAPGKGGI